MKKRLYDKNYHQNENGKELFSRIQDATEEVVEEFLGMGYDAHDIERIATMGVTNRILVWLLENNLSMD